MIGSAFRIVSPTLDKFCGNYRMPFTAVWSKICDPGESFNHLSKMHSTFTENKDSLFSVNVLCIDKQCQRECYFAKQC